MSRVGAPKHRRWVLRALFAATLMVACEPTDEVVFRGPDAGTGGDTSSGTGGAGGLPGSGGVATGGAATGGVATGGVPPPGTGGARPSPIPCKGPDDCGRNETCNKSGCGPDVIGTCEPRPQTCGSEEALVCGCDGITYWNDCLRLQQRVPLRSPGQCRSTAIPCFDRQPCGAAVCALLMPDITDCAQVPPPPQPPEPPPGRCFMPPPTCEGASNDSRWQACAGPGFPPLATCLNLCETLQQRGLYVAMPTPNSCPAMP